MGIWLSDLCDTMPIRVSCIVAIYFLMLGILNNLFPTVSFLICCSFTSVILMPSMCRMIQCRNTSNVFKVGMALVIH